MKPLYSVTIAVVALYSILAPLNGQTTPDYLHCDHNEDLIDPPLCYFGEEGKPTYYPYPYNCHKYFECDNWVAKCFWCALGTVWNDTEKTCTHEDFTDCVIVTTLHPGTWPTTQPTTEAPAESPRKWRFSLLGLHF